MLGEEPWLNASSACAFPPSQSSLSRATKYTVPKSKENFQMIDIEKHSVPKHLIDQFVGNYGNFAYGNISVVVDDITEDVILTFDIYRCLLSTRIHRNETFYCQGLDDYWFIDLLFVEFDMENTPSQFVEIVFLTPLEGRVRYERDLHQDDAPGPRDHWPKCEETQVEIKAK